MASLTRSECGGEAADPPAGGSPKLDLGDLLALQTLILRRMGAGDPADAVAQELCDFAHWFSMGRIAALLHLGADGRLRPVAVAGGGAQVRDALDGLVPGPRAGSSGTAVHLNTPVLVRDAREDPRWAGLQEVATRLGIRACWSHPVLKSGTAIGSFSLSGPEPGDPPASALLMLEHGAAIASSILQLLELQRDQARQAERMRRLTGFNAMLAQVNQLAAGRPDETALYEGICRIAVTEGGLRLIWIGAPDAHGVFHPSAAAGAVGFLDHVFISADPALPEGRGLSGTAWREARTVVRQHFCADDVIDPRVAAARQFGLGSGAALPLMLRGTPKAVLHLYAADEDVLDQELIRLVEELAVDVGRALEALDQQRHLDRLEALHQVLLAEGEVLLQARSEAEILEQTCARLAGSALFDVAWIARPDAEGLMQPLVGAGAAMVPLGRLRYALDEDPPALVVRAWREGHTQSCNDIAQEPDLARFRTLVDETGWRAAGMVPVLRAGKLFAILALGSKIPGLFTTEVLALCERVADLLGRGLDELDLKQTLERERGQQFHLARHDPLTGLANRLLFEEHLADALARARRHDAPLAVCLLDLDDFKPVNDRWGHPAGDAVLREVARRLSEALRRSDLLARLGGDEFVLAVEDLGSLDALPALLSRLSASMEPPITLPDGEATLCFSVGAAVFPEDGDDPDILVRRADAALYAAKTKKAERAHNWRRWSVELAAPSAAAPPLDGAFGAEAKQLLAATEALWRPLAEGMAEDLLAGIGPGGPASAIASQLPVEAQSNLEQWIVAHVLEMMSPDADPAQLTEGSRAAGLVHALIGFDGAVLMEGIGRLQARLADALARSTLRPSDRQNLLAAALARLQADCATQMAVRSETISAYFKVVLCRHVPTSRWVDAVQAQFDQVAALPGILEHDRIRLNRILRDAGSWHIRLG